MQLATAIAILAGGPGSGCHGPNCGRPSIGIGDKVRLQRPVKMWHEESGDIRKVPKGTDAIVLNVLPKIGTADQMASIHVEGHDPEHVALNDLALHQTATSQRLPVYQDVGKVSRTGNYTPVLDKQGHVIAPDPNAFTIKSVPKSQTIMTTTTSDGARLTWVKPRDEESKDIKDMSSEPHRLKGDFALITKVSNGLSPADSTRTSRLYDTSGLPAHLHEGPGASVQIDSYVRDGKIKAVTVEERNYTTAAQRVSQATFEYHNAAQAVGMLKQRYGIITSMKRLRSE